MIPQHENWYDRNARSDSAISPPPNTIISDFLYLSSAPTAAHLPHLLNTGITHVLNLSSCSNYWASQSDISLGWSRIQNTDRRFYASLVKQHGCELASAPIPFGYKAPTYLHIDIEDVEDVSLADHFLECIVFIREAYRQNPNARILVHCYQGRSRSASIVIAYVMWACAVSYEEAFRRVRNCRQCIAPNSGFVKQLLQFESDLWSARRIKVNSNNIISSSSSSSSSSDDELDAEDEDEDVDDELTVGYYSSSPSSTTSSSSSSSSSTRLYDIASLLEPGWNNLNEMRLPFLVAS